MPGKQAGLCLYLPLYKLTYFLLLSSKLILVSNIFTFSSHHVLNCVLQTQWLTYQWTYQLLHKLFGLKKERGKRKELCSHKFPLGKTSTPTLKQVSSGISHCGAGVLFIYLKIHHLQMGHNQPHQTQTWWYFHHWNCLYVIKNSQILIWTQHSGVQRQWPEHQGFLSVKCSFLPLVLLPAQRKVHYTKLNNFNANLIKRSGQLFLVVFTHYS